MDVRLHVDTRDLEAGLARLERKVRRRVVKRSLQAGGGVIKRALQGAAPVATGALKKSIVVVTRYRGRMMIVGAGSDKVYTYRKSKTGKYRTVGKKTKLKAGERTYKRRPAKYAHLVAKGHGGPHPARGTYWMEKAFKRVQYQAAAKVVSKMKEMITQG